jgi:hypothetical protein
MTGANSEVQAMEQSGRLTKQDASEAQGMLSVLNSLCHCKKLLVDHGAGALLQRLRSMQHDAEENGPKAKVGLLTLHPLDSSCTHRCCSNTQSFKLS